MPGLNRLIYDKSVVHGIYLTRLQAHEANVLSKFIRDEVQDDLFGVITSKLRRIKRRGGFSKSPFGLTTYEDLVDTINESIKVGYKEALERTKQSLYDVAEYEAKFQSKLVTKTDPKIKLTAPDSKDLKASVTKRPIHGRTLTKHFNSLSNAAADSIVQVINKGLVSGKDAETILSEIESEAFEQSLNQANAVAKTLVNHVANHAREATWDRNKNEIKGIMYIAVLDTATTLVCANLHGTVFPVDEGERPPQHYGCRSTTMVVLLNEGPIPVQTYSEWLSEQDNETQDTALGKTKAKWFREGRITPKQMADQSGRPLTLVEIIRREGLSA